MHSNKVSFIIGARIKNQSKEITANFFDKSDYKEIDSKQQKTERLYKQIHINEHYTMTVTYSPKRAGKDKYDREKAINKLKNKLHKSKNPK